ncbi:MAG TPA: hypothetical protein VII72_20500 [Myxococcota bacterium]
MGQETQWRRCSACKQPIAVSSIYWVCGVSTCNRERTGLVFCSVRCWEEHLPSANHREAWAVEKTAPATPAAAARPAPEKSAPARPVAAQKPAAKAPEEVLIVASRLKDYIRETSGFSTSDRVLAPLSVIVRRLCDEAVKNATREGRTTVLDRDIPRG